MCLLSVRRVYVKYTNYTVKDKRFKREWLIKRFSRGLTKTGTTRMCSIGNRERPGKELKNRDKSKTRRNDSKTDSRGRVYSSGRGVVLAAVKSF